MTGRVVDKILQSAVREARTSLSSERLRAVVQAGIRSGLINQSDLDEFGPVLDALDRVKLQLVEYIIASADDQKVRNGWWQMLDDACQRARQSHKPGPNPVHPDGPHDQTPRTFAWSDIQWIAEVAPGRQNTAYVQVRVWKYFSDMNGGPAFNDEDQVGQPSDQMEDRNKAAPFLTGTIKWDGCSDLAWHERHNHFCDPDQVANFGEMLQRLYDAAHQVLTESNPDGRGVDFDRRTAVDVRSATNQLAGAVYNMARQTIEIAVSRPGRFSPED